MHPFLNQTKETAQRRSSRAQMEIAQRKLGGVTMSLTAWMAPMRITVMCSVIVVCCSDILFPLLLSGSTVLCFLEDIFLCLFCLLFYLGVVSLYTSVSFLFYLTFRRSTFDKTGTDSSAKWDRGHHYHHHFDFVFGFYSQCYSL